MIIVFWDKMFFIGKNVFIGNNVKIQNNVSVYNGVELNDDVFCGPSCVFTNITNPRSFIEQKDKFIKNYSFCWSNYRCKCNYYLW